MKFYGYDQDKAIANCSSRLQGEFQQDIATGRSWQTLGPEHVVGLLGNAGMSARPAARALAGLLAQMSWRILAPARSGGSSGAHETDNLPQVMLAVAGRIYHLRFKAAPTLHVIGITT